MKHITKPLSLALALLMLVSLFTLAPITASAVETQEAIVGNRYVFPTDGYYSGDYQYYLSDDGTAEIIEYRGNNSDVVIPSSIDGHTVTRIGGYAFYWSSIESVRIPDSVESIGYFAFISNNSLNKVVLGKGIKTIEGCAFYCCKNLKSITIPDSVTSILDNAFGYYFASDSDEKVDGFKITGYTNSEAERYANDNGFEFISLGEAPSEATEPTTETIEPSESATNPTETTEDTQPTETEPVETEPTQPTETEPTQPTETEPTQPTETQPTTEASCQHSNTKATGTKQATYFAKGYTGDKVCSNCGEKLSTGKAIPKKVLKTPKVKIKPAKKSITVKYTKVKDAKGFVVSYKLGKKTYTKTFKATKSKAVKLKNLKSGKKYTVKVRAYIKSGKKTAYSKWTKAKTVKVK